MNRLGTIMFRGLVAMLPAILTIYILFWLVRSAETVLGGMLKVLLPVGWYIPGMGLLAGIAATFLFGLGLNAFMVRRLLDLSEKVADQIPVIKTLYGSLKDFIGFFANQRDSQFSQVVSIELEFGGKPMRLIGFVTRSDFSTLPAGIAEEDEIAVYLPLSYQIGGYTVIVPRSAVKPINISTHRAMGFVVTGGMAADKGHADKTTP
ncbi:DUF502 domain-containing protein [Trichlorobacter lovleyi]|uniref:DUF502 domain-containing protein n=1 Tax=Trichlorobacter lovleyi TaxID=313985 RepID=UPI002240411C|nr:DUF502 domain-containing protein [Trichlorobacter lovleyi]QOX78251.1 DUF502 domain-containing protein [Trichlorobacter lovleyi]